MHTVVLKLYYVIMFLVWCVRVNLRRLNVLNGDTRLIGLANMVSRRTYFLVGSQIPLLQLCPEVHSSDATVVRVGSDICSLGLTSPPIMSLHVFLSPLGKNWVKRCNIFKQIQSFNKTFLNHYVLVTHWIKQQLKLHCHHSMFSLL